MMSWILSRVIELVFGMLYPAYASYKAVKAKNIREYVRWMMYWIVFALFMATETFTDLLISWFPFYYEVKMAFVLWLLSPYTRGASLLYRRFVHPTLARKEKDIDTFLVRTRERGYETMLHFGKRGLNLAATAAVQAATKSQGALAGRLRSFSMQDLRCIPDQGPAPFPDPLYLEEQDGRRLGELGQGGLGAVWGGSTKPPGAVPCQPAAVVSPLSPLCPGCGAAPPARRYESDTDGEDDEELWSDSGVTPQPSPRRDPKPLSRSQSLRSLRKTPAKEGSSRLLRSRIRRKTAPSEQDS
ncbi:receptor expression-enhancing protein 4 isoform X1 [Manacus candei]|uniref:receptor expression-enhancing protein 4 isoform X1 n=1 Tax=Manacus candei TaxID=415023 RepID=UPI0022276BBD|nr:receptor expression-enhancing protein 4 isoform X1 [Manacus candei]